MILVDANILLYAEDTLAEHHDAAQEWWDQQLSGKDPVCLCWPVLTAFIRIGTNPRLHRRRPLTLSEALGRVQSWLEQPCTRLITPTEHHWSIFARMLRQANASADLVSDAHLAALALEHGCKLISTDTDFARFSDLHWINPLGNR